MALIRSILAVSLTLALAVACFTRTAVFLDEVSLWEDAAAKSPNKARPHNNLGRAYLEAGRREEAQPFILRALTLNPDYLDARYNLAVLLYTKGMKTEAEREFSWIIEHHPLTGKATFARSMLRIIRSEER